MPLQSQTATQQPEGGEPQPSTVVKLLRGEVGLVGLQFEQHEFAQGVDDGQVSPGPALRRKWKQQGFSPLVLGDCTVELRNTYKFSARQLPWAVLGDFNGDGKTDLVVDGRKGKSTLRLAFLSPSYARQLSFKIDPTAFVNDNIPPFWIV